MFEDKFFIRRKKNDSKLLSYGFEKKAEQFQYSVPVMNGTFLLWVFVCDDGTVTTKMIDSFTNEEYSLYKSESSVGTFVGQVRTICEEVLTDISEKCFDTDVFRSTQTLEIIEYVKRKYGDEPEFLWEKFSDSAVLRRKDTKKWYGVIMTLSKRKLGLDSNEIVEIIDLRLDPELMDTTVDRVKFFPGWHMNKKSWYTIILDGSVSTDEIRQRIDRSYILAIK